MREKCDYIEPKLNKINLVVSWTVDDLCETESDLGQYIEKERIGFYQEWFQYVRDEYE